MGGFSFTIPRGYTVPSTLEIPGVTVSDFYGGQRAQVAPDAPPASTATLTQAVSQAVNEMGPANQRMYRDFIDRSALDYAEIERRKADSMLPTAVGLLAAAAMPYAAPALGSLLGGVTGIGALGTAAAPSLLGSTVGGALIGGATAAATGDSIVEGVLTGGLSGGLAGVDVGQVLPAASRATQMATDTGVSALSALSAAGPAVMDTERQDAGLEDFQNAPVVDAVVGGVPVILDQPPTYVEPVVEPKEEDGGGGSAAGGATAPTGGAAAQTDGEVQGGVSDAQTGAQAGSEATEGVDPVVANQILEAILSETDQNVRDGLISDWQNYTGETFDNTLLPDYQEQAPPEPVGYVWGDGVWTPVFDIPPAGSVIFEPGAQQPDYTPQEDEVVDITGDLIDAAGGLLDSTIDADTTVDIEPVDTTTVEPVDTTTVEPVDTTTEGPEGGTTGGDQSVDVGGEGTGDGTGVGAGVGSGEGDGEGEGDGTGTGMMAAAAAGAAFEPKWTELFKYTTLTPYQKKAIAPYVDYIAQARGMLS